MGGEQERVESRKPKEGSVSGRREPRDPVGRRGKLRTEQCSENRAVRLRGKEARLGLKHCYHILEVLKHLNALFKN